MEKNNFVTVIGGANIDIQGTSNVDIINGDSNPGKVNISLGGVGRNIAENISKLGIKTKLITVMGEDTYGEYLLNACKKSGIDMEDALIIKDGRSSVYLSIHDNLGDMKIAISDMEIINKLSKKFIIKKDEIISNSRLAVIDSNISKETIEYLLKKHNNLNFFLDPVSITKARKIKDLIGYFHTIKPNVKEAEELWGYKIKSVKDLEKSREYFLDKGVKRIFISLGKDGVFYGNEDDYDIIKPYEIRIASVTGAGDAFMAGLIYSYIKEFDIKESAKFSMAASALAISSISTINPELSLENINKILKEMII